MKFLFPTSAHKPSEARKGKRADFEFQVPGSRFQVPGSIISEDRFHNFRGQVINRHQAMPMDRLSIDFQRKWLNAGKKSQQGLLLEAELGYPVPEIPGSDWIWFWLDR
jgi:hypothetical protein